MALLQAKLLLGMRQKIGGFFFSSSCGILSQACELFVFCSSDPFRL